MDIQEFQAVVLAGGKGSRMVDLTASKPKCLLPVGNLPLIWYPLQMLKKIGFKDVIVVTLESAKAEILALRTKCGLDLNLEVVTLPGGSSSGIGPCNNEPDSEVEGTADAIRLIHGHLKAARIMIVSGDLITDVQINRIADLHRAHRSAVTALFSPLWVEPKDVQIPGPKTKPKKERDMVGIDHVANGRLCYLSSEADLEDFLIVKKAVLVDHPKITIYNNLVDAHFYIMEKWVCDFIALQRKFSTIKGELLPYLIRKQYCRKLKRIVGPKYSDKLPHFDEESPNSQQKNGGDSSSCAKVKLEDHVPADQMARQIQEWSSWNENSGDLVDSYRGRAMRCYAFVADPDQLCVRVNNPCNFVELNRKIEKVQGEVPSFLPAVHPTSKVDDKAQVGSECLVGDGTVISEKTTIKNSVIGANCKVEPKTRINNCIIMSNVHVKSGSNLQGSILCDGVVVNERCDVKDTIVGKGQEVAAGGKHVNELLAKDDSALMEI